MFTPGCPHVSYNWNRTGTSEASGNAAREKFLGWQPWPWDVALLESSAIQTCHIWNFNFSGFSPFFFAKVVLFYLRVGFKKTAHKLYKSTWNCALPGTCGWFFVGKSALVAVQNHWRWGCLRGWSMGTQPCCPTWRKSRLIDMIWFSH